MTDQNELPEGTDSIVTGAGVTSDTDVSTDVDVNVGVTGDLDDQLTAADLTAEDLTTDTDLNSDIEEQLTVTDQTPSDQTPGDQTPGDQTPGDQIGASSKRAKVVAQVKSGSNKLAGQAADKTRGLVGQGLERSSEALANVSKMVGDTAAGIDDRLGAEYGDYARRAASAIDNAANSLAAKDADELIDDTRDFVKKSPGIALAGAAVVGFVLARLVKTGLDNDKPKA
jgi:ElaB/YqjD/DUF883 family membrane-anchored ribosome-binding protein